MSLEFGISIAQTAGKIILDAFHQPKHIDTKSSLADLVTETDRFVEETVQKCIRDRYPEHRFIGEETVSDGAKIRFTDDPTWIIDPIDGTSNFIHRFPYCCISIAFAVNKKVQFGIVFNPILNHLYHAENGKGAFKNGVPIHVSDATALVNSLICTEFGGARDSTMEVRVQNMGRVVMASRGIRSLGSAAMNMCMVAEGAAECYYEYGIHCWDIAAAELIVREAGGHTSCLPTGSPVDIMSRTILSSCSSQVSTELSQQLHHIHMENEACSD